MAIRPDLSTARGRLVLAFGARVLRWIVLLIGRSCRFEIVEGQPFLARALADRRPVILSFWHNRSFLLAHHLLYHLQGHGLSFTILASQSRDGELVTQMAKLWRLRIIRGSASRGGSAALRGVYKAVTKEGGSPIMIPDGPRGPLYHFKLGVAVLAQMSQAPILPVALAAERCWRLKSWDRLIVPKPFSRIVMVVGPPQMVSRALSSVELEGERQRLQDLLVDLTRRAESALGAQDMNPDSEEAR